MATTDIGRAVPLLRGEYDPAQTYELNDIVSLNGSLYWHYSHEVTTNVAPQATSTWKVVLSLTDAEAYIARAESAAEEAESAKDDAVTAKTAAETASATATGASEAATAAKDDAVTARNAAQTAETGAVEAKNAAVSAKEAAQSAASSAGTSATSAGNSAGTAEYYATNAETAAETATTKASEASASASTASSAATTATEAKNTAVSSASTATTKAGEASTSATSAASSAAAAQAVKDSIPQDYTALSEDVDDLKTQVTQGVIISGLEDVTEGFYYSDNTKIENSEWCYGYVRMYPENNIFALTNDSTITVQTVNAEKGLVKIYKPAASTWIGAGTYNYERYSDTEVYFRISVHIANRNGVNITQKNLTNIRLDTLETGLDATNTQFIYPTSKIVPITQGYWAFADGKAGDSNTWCKTDYLYKDVVMATSTLKMYLVAYDANGTFIGGWNGTEFTTTYNQNAGVREIKISEWVDSYPNYRFRVDFNKGTTTITPADVYSELVVESDVYNNIARMDNDIAQLEASVDAVSTDLVNKTAKQIIIDCLKNIAWTTPNGNDYVTALSTALYGGDTPIYTLDSHQFDGDSESAINTGVILFDTDQDFTILLEVTTTTSQSGDWAIIQGYSEADVSGLLIGKGYGANITTNFRFMNKIGLESNVNFTSNYIGTTKIAIRHTAESGAAIFNIKTGSDEPVEIERTGATFTASNASIYLGGADTGRGFKGTISCKIYDSVKNDIEVNAFMEVGM